MSREILAAHGYHRGAALVVFVFTKFSGTVILRDAFSLLDMWFFLEIRRYPALAGFKALRVGSNKAGTYLSVTI